MLGFQAAYARRGVKLELGERLALGYQFHIASNREQAIREAAPHYEENMKMFGELRLVRALTDEQIAAICDPGSPAFVTPKGEPLAAHELTRWLRKARLVRTSLDVNGSICRSLLQIRSQRAAELEEVGT